MRFPDSVSVLVAGDSAGEVEQTLSPSMDIQVPSNFERALFEASGRDAGWMSQAMQDFIPTRRLAIPPSVLHVLKERYLAARADDSETIATVARCALPRMVAFTPSSL